jgi:hypothetical protein
MECKNTILLFFDALFSLFELGNKPVYRVLLRYRHIVRNVLTEDALLSMLVDFIRVPGTHEKISRQITQGVCDIQEFRNELTRASPEIYKDVQVLLDSCSLENKKVVWKWVNTITGEALEDHARRVADHAEAQVADHAEAQVADHAE